MREIKFRVGEREVGVVFDVYNIDFANTMATTYLKNGTEFFINYSEDNFKLLQYTGLKDKNSVEIYEGDIVRCISSETEIYISTVKYENGALTVEVKDEYYYRTVLQWALEAGVIEDVKVLGNIYENKELLNES